MINFFDFNPNIPNKFNSNNVWQPINSRQRDEFIPPSQQLLIKMKITKQTYPKKPSFPTLHIRIWPNNDENIVVFNSVIFAEIGIAKPSNEPKSDSDNPKADSDKPKYVKQKESRKYIIHKIIYISYVEETCIEIPSEDEDFDLYFCLLPFKPVMLPNMPLYSAVINSLLPITKQIHTFLPPNDFPFMSAIINLQNFESDSSISQLITYNTKQLNQFQKSIISSNETTPEISTIEQFTGMFCEENGFEYMVIKQYPSSKLEITDDKRTDILLFFPQISNEPRIEPIISLDDQSYYHVVSLIAKQNGHYSAQVSTRFGCYEFYEKGITKLEKLMYRVEEKTIISLLYIRNNIYEYFYRIPYCPHPYVKNPKIIEYPELGRGTGNHAFYYDYNEKYNKFPCIPSPFPRSHSVIKTQPKKRGQLVWRINKDDSKSHTPVYIEGFQFKVSDLCNLVLDKCNESKDKTEVALVKTRGNFAQYVYNPDEIISFPIESLLVIDVELPNDDGAEIKDNLIVISYGYVSDKYQLPLKYFRPPRVMHYSTKRNIEIKGRDFTYLQPTPVKLANNNTHFIYPVKKNKESDQDEENPINKNYFVYPLCMLN